MPTVGADPFGMPICTQVYVYTDGDLELSASRRRSSQRRIMGNQLARRWVDTSAGSACWNSAGQPPPQLLPRRASVNGGLDSKRRTQASSVFVAGAALAVALGPRAAASQDCIEYADYLHWVGSVATPGYAQSVALSGRYAYVAARFSGLQVIDITIPASPQIVGAADTPGDAYG